MQICSYTHIEPKMMIIIKELKSALEVNSSNIQVLYNNLAKETVKTQCLEGKLQETREQVATLQALASAPLQV